MDRMASLPVGGRTGGLRNRMMMTAAATLRQRRLNRAIATVNQARLKRQPPIGGNGPANRRLSRMDLARSLSKAKLIRQRSNSRANVNVNAATLRRSNSRSNLQAVRGQSSLRRSNSRLNLNQIGQMVAGQQPRRKINRDFQQRSRSRSRGKTPSIASRLGVRPGNVNNNNGNHKGAQPRGGGPVAGNQRQRSNSISGRLGKQGVLNRVAQGRVTKQQRLGVAQNKQQNKGIRNQQNIKGNNNNNNFKKGNNIQGRNGKQVVR